MATCRDCAYLRKCIDEATKGGYEHNVDFDPKDGCTGWGFKSNTAADTNADRIRAMSDEELAKMLYCSDSLGWCHNLPECADMLDTDDGIPEEKCMACLVEWLRQPAEE